LKEASTVRSLFLVVALFAGAAAAAAQIHGPEVFDDSLVVTASLEPSPAEDLTASATVIERDEIEARQATTVADLLATVPGVHVARSGSAGKVTSLFVRGTESDHTLVLWNGVELNNPFFGGFDWAFLPADDLARVEVVRGPFSALYGAEAVGGVVQLLSKPGRGGAVSLEVGPDRYRRAVVSAGTGADRFELDVTGSLRRGDGLTVNDFFSSDDLALHGKWEATENLQLALVARHNDSRNGIPFSAGQPSPRREIAWREHQVALPFALVTRDWEVEGRLSRVSYDQRFSDPEDAFGFTDSRTDSRASRLRATAARRFGQGGWLALGVEREELAVDDRSVFGVTLESARQVTRSVFVESARDLGALRLDIGARHDDSDVFGGTTTPRAGLRLRLGSKTRLRAAWGEGFRAPSLGELFYPLSGNAELAPEESASWELGVEHDRRRWRLGATAFHTRLRNLIDFDFQTFSNVNVGRARSRGLELWSRYLGRHLEIRADATLVDSEDLASGEQLLRRPETAASMVLTAAPGAWTVSLTGRYVGARADIDPRTLERLELEEYARLDVAARYRWRPAIEPYARIENLGNSSFQEIAGFPAAGRQWIGGVAVRWGRER
jgi:vitamin B12 transporter